MTNETTEPNDAWLRLHIVDGYTAAEAIEMTTGAGILHLYIMLREEPLQVKIGISNNPRRRLEELRRQHDEPDIRLMAYLTATAREVVVAEKEIHRQLRHFNVGSNRVGCREWFDGSAPEVDVLVTGLIEHAIENGTAFVERQTTT